MSLIDLNLTSFPYLISRGLEVGGSGGTSNPVNVAIFANSVISSDRITVNSNSRITFQESGWYEVDCPFSAGLFTLSGTFRTLTLQYGINNNWVSLCSSESVDIILTSRLHLNFMFYALAGQYFEMRSVINGTIAQHYTAAAINNNNFLIKRVY